ncbi:PRA1 family protein 1 [Tieghemostelium lacteum]|uniref:PRA1 family protein n=1 Tax=Tieghemostelium lacteum TaxID=361077 RepID=A0A151Z9B9_TIELA|nr:PRA1 family protein 1 [Tieghemostelium lacteum]|eukprot:KYQ90464.1 PRA1 family protein 1 [Tieghemostelium lacteum]
MENNTSGYYNQNEGISGENVISSDNYYANPQQANDSDMNSNNSSTSNSNSSTTIGFGASSLEPSTITHRIGQLTNKLKEFKDNRFEQTRNWYQFIGPEKGKYTVPSINESTNRIKENVVYFQTNYLILFLIFGVYFVMLEPFFLFLLVLLFLITIYIHYINPNLTDIQKKIGYGLQVFLSVYFILSAHHTVFWVIGACLVIVLLHASLHVPTEQRVTYGGDV